MALLREWRCAAHGEFSNKSGKCPHGCSKRFVVQEIRTAPGFHSAGSKRVDSELKGLAADYGMSNIKTGNEGESVMQALRRSDPTSAMPTWGKVDHAAPGFSSRGEKPRTYSPGYTGVSIDSVKPSFAPISQMTRIAGRDSTKVQ
jgi:hypothetical protein